MKRHEGGNVRLTGPRRRAGVDEREAPRDSQLLERITRRDLQAFEQLYRHYQPRLSRFLINIVNRPQVVEEVLDDTMMAVWNTAANFRGASKVSTWIFAIAYRTALKALRSQDEPVESGSDDELLSEEAGPEQQLMAGQARSTVLRALDALSAEQRSVLVLTYFHDLPYAEIARIVDCPVDTVKTRVFHGRRRLRAMLQGDPEGSS
jgi:RNA polymerase sigma factor (sigma-70 family)